VFQNVEVFDEAGTKPDTDRESPLRLESRACFRIDFGFVFIHCSGSSFAFET
jgi:hypothetical protein